MANRYEAGGPQGEYEPGSRGRVLRNLQQLRRVADVQRAESDALVRAQDAMLDQYTSTHRFTAADICSMHRQWLDGLYSWAGEYRNVNISKDGFLFAAAAQVPRLMAEFETRELRSATPCEGFDIPRLVAALARTHGELVLIHPFREGNGRCARMLAWLMALQAGLPSLDFSPMSGRGRTAYFSAIQASMQRNYAPLEAMFEKVVRKTLASYDAET